MAVKSRKARFRWEGAQYIRAPRAVNRLSSFSDRRRCSMNTCLAGGCRRTGAEWLFHCRTGGGLKGFCERVQIVMEPFKTDFLRTLSERGYIHQITDGAGLDAHLNSGVISAYIGFDATADSLHIGSLVQIMLLRRLQQAGHRPIVLMGGGTTKIGDPSGRDETRQLLTEAQINANIAGIREIFGHFLRFDDGPSGAIMANNDDWLSGLQYIPFLRDIC